jgi:hypothetical protein
MIEAIKMGSSLWVEEELSSEMVVESGGGGRHVADGGRTSNESGPERLVKELSAMHGSGLAFL